MRLWRLGEAHGGTHGILVVGEARLATVELPWRDNERGSSCIPAGDYPLEVYWSNNTEEWRVRIKDVPGRSHCAIHTANEPRQLRGCVAPGMRRSKDGRGVERSRQAMSIVIAAVRAGDDVLRIRVAAPAIVTELDLARPTPSRPEP